MRLLRRRQVVSVVVPAYNVAQFLPACLDSVLVQSYDDLEVLLVDDGSTDDTGAIADSYADRDPRVRVVHSENRGLGAARNLGVRSSTGDFVTFLDSDDVLPADAYAPMASRLRAGAADFVCASFVRWEDGWLDEPAWMRRLHSPARHAITAEDHPEILGDVLVCDKMFRRAFVERTGLVFPEGTRYEDQPVTTKAFLRGRFDVIPDIVYHWRIRTDGSSITQQRRTMADLVDRVETKRTSLTMVREEGSAAVLDMFVDRVLPGDMWRYFIEIPGASDEWWTLLRSAVVEFWGTRSLVHSGLPPVHRLTGWLVEQDRRADAVAVMEYLAENRIPRVRDAHGEEHIEVPVIDMATVDPAATAVRPDERRPAR